MARPTTSDAATRAASDPGSALMQVPAQFEYERATSVEHAVALLARYGPEARVVAGGHSLIPMMKLRIANPETLIDINDLAELTAIRLEGDELRLGAMVRHAELLASRGRRRALPDLPRRRAGDRRPGGAQPRHHRRLAVPGRPVGGPVRGVHRRERRGGDPGRGRPADRPGAGVPHRAVPDGRRRRRAARRDPGADPARRRQRLREGRASGRRLGRGRGRCRALAGRRHGRPTSASG